MQACTRELQLQLQLQQPKCKLEVKRKCNCGRRKGVQEARSSENAWEEGTPYLEKSFVKVHKMVVLMSWFCTARVVLVDSIKMRACEGDQETKAK